MPGTVMQFIIADRQIFFPSQNSVVAVTGTKIRTPDEQAKATTK